MKNTLNINESFICRIWETEEYYTGLKTTDGEPVKILDFGSHNSDSGPDYKNARVQIGPKTFAGDIEVHRDFNGWHEHSHKKDSAYNSVILQVVLWRSSENQKPQLRKKRDLPTIILSDFLTRSIRNIWQEIINDPSGKFRLPCYGLNSSITESELKSFLLKLSTDRLRMKSNRLKERLKELVPGRNGNETATGLRKSALWNQLLYEFIFEALGYAKNKEQMLKLTQSVKLSAIEKSGYESRLQIQAALFGCSGFLFDLRIRDDYVNEIKSIWDEAKDDFSSERLIKSEWKFFRMRPQNFPTIRLAYGSQLIRKIITGSLLKNIILQFRSINYSVKDCYGNLSDMLAPDYDEYWSEHYNFGKKTAKPYNLLGKERIHDIVANVLIPLVYLYSIVFSDNEIKLNVLRLYRELKIRADNSILNLMTDQLIGEKGIEIRSPAIEQGVMHLYNFYCMRRKCNDCKCGQLIKRDEGFNYQIIFY